VGSRSASLCAHRLRERIGHDGGRRAEYVAPGKLNTAHCSSQSRAGAVASHAEQSAVARLDLLARPLDAGGVLLHGLDIAERLAAGLLLDQRMHRPQGPDIDDELLAFLREAIALEQSRRVRMG